MDLDARLTPDHLAGLLPRLGLRPDDAADTTAAARGVLGEPAARDRLGDMVDRVEGRGADVLGPSVFTADDAESPWGRGVLPLLALVATAPEAAERHTARGIPGGLAWASLADLGQQVWVHRQVTGTFGLHNQDWLGGNWAGGLVWLGRLQFDVEPMRCDVEGIAAGEPAWFCHIPETGPLAPGAVDESLALARTWLPRWYPEARSSAIFCDSWLLDPTLSRLVGERGNIAGFARRFEPLGLDSCGRRDAMYFGFHREQPCDVAELPVENAFHRALAEHLRGGGTFRITLGRLT